MKRLDFYQRQENVIDVGVDIKMSDPDINAWENVARKALIGDDYERIKYPNKKKCKEITAQDILDQLK